MALCVRMAVCEYLCVCVCVSVCECECEEQYEGNEIRNANNSMPFEQCN